MHLGSEVAKASSGKLATVWQRHIMKSSTLYKRPTLAILSLYTFSVDW
jgi:hypothetical protein